jgi:hypothetical protein
MGAQRIFKRQSFNFYFGLFLGLLAKQKSEMRNHKDRKTHKKEVN